MSIETKNKEFASYELVASAKCKQVHIYGRTLEEVSVLSVSSIRETKCADLKAIEQGRYASFILEHINDYNVSQHLKKLQLAKTLTECSLFVLRNSKRNRKGFYNKQIGILEKYRAEAIRLLSAVR